MTNKPVEFVEPTDELKNAYEFLIIAKHTLQGDALIDDAKALRLIICGDNKLVSLTAYFGSKFDVKLWCR